MAFHLSLSVADPDRTERFYVDVLGARVGRQTDRWTDLWLFGTQLTVHHRPEAVLPAPQREAMHFGATLGWDEWRDLAARLADNGAPFRSEPRLDEAKGQARLTLVDPDGHLVEIKAYRDPETLQQPD